MTYEINPIPDVPALLIEGKERTLVVADLHLGYEHELLKSGINMPNQTKNIHMEIEQIICDSCAENLIFLGDLKHNIPNISAIEARSIPRFMDFDIPFELVKGNHDGNIENLTGLTAKPFVQLGDILLTHGHMNIPDVEFRTLIVGHSHPAIEITDELGRRTKEKCWIRGIFPSGHELIVMPAFNPLITGIPFNRKDARIPGSIFKRFSIEELEMTAYLLDGTCLGALKNIA